MGIFEIKPGSSTPFHSHKWEHEVFVLSGRGKVKDERGETQVGEGDFVAPNERHCFTNAGDDNFRFICVIPLVK